MATETEFELLQRLVAIPAPPGGEQYLADAVAALVRELELKCEQDSKGNLIVSLGDNPRVVVTAHLDEIAMMVQGIRADGQLAVAPLGGLKPWKLGEGPVQIRGLAGTIDGVLSFGGIHTESPNSTVRQAEEGPVGWGHATVFTGLTADECLQEGIVPGCRVVVHPSRRELLPMPPYVGGYFLDDRALLVSWLTALRVLAHSKLPVTFIATVSEEVGGEGALYALRSMAAETCIALELGPNVEDAPVSLTGDPTLWARDSYAAMTEPDLRLAAELDPGLQFQALTRGGSDASVAVSAGLCARCFTLGIPMENSHGFEIIHRDSMGRLAALTVALVRRLASD